MYIDPAVSRLKFQGTATEGTLIASVLVDYVVMNGNNIQSKHSVAFPITTDNFPIMDPELNGGDGWQVTRIALEGANAATRVAIIQVTRTSTTNSRGTVMKTQLIDNDMCVYTGGQWTRYHKSGIPYAPIVLP